MNLTVAHIRVLNVVGEEKISGREIRNHLKNIGFNLSAPAFYQLMSELEEFGHILGEYEEKCIDGQKIRQRVYRVEKEEEQDWK